MKGISQPRIGRPQWTVLNTMHLTVFPKRLEQRFSPVECFWIVDETSWRMPWKKQLPPGFHGNSGNGSFWFWPKKEGLVSLDPEKRWDFSSNVRSPNHSPGKKFSSHWDTFQPKRTPLDTWWHVFIIKALAPATLERICDLSIYHLLHDPYSPGEIISNKFRLGLGKAMTET